MATINFESELYNIDSWTVLRLPDDASAKLPSRGQVFVKGTINGTKIQSALEPTGRGSHWLNLDKKLQNATGLKAGDIAELEIESTKDWPEPDIPDDIKKALSGAPDVQKLWQSVTPMARWEWIRWIVSTSNKDTRANRIEVGFSKLRNGERRPCCFNRSMSCVPEVSKNGVLLEPAQLTK
jgi:hypothetical protein